jgi:Tn3 transposase DDE domain
VRHFTRLSDFYFRREIHRPAEPGRGRYSLQQAIQQGGSVPSAAKPIEQLAAISGFLTLLANVIMAWNTHKIHAIYMRQDWQNLRGAYGLAAPVANAGSRRRYAG